MIVLEWIGGLIAAFALFVVLANMTITPEQREQFQNERANADVCDKIMGNADTPEEKRTARFMCNNMKK
jgi:hypothetical protein